MIHYHGTPFGGTRVDAARFLAGRHALIPYTRPEDLEIAKEVCSSFIVDSGAFSIWRQGGVLDADGYAAWVEAIYRHPAFDWALISDVINGNEAENDALLANWPRHIAGVPVYHLHESLERAERLSHQWPIVAIGSSGEWPNPGERLWVQRMAQVMDVMCEADGMPRCKIHGLRMMDPAIFTRYPFRSVDSTNCAQNGARNGRGIDPVLSRSQGAIITAWRVEAHQSPATWDRLASSLVRENLLF